MSITKEEKTKIISDFQNSANDTGSTEVQIAILTKKINTLTQHFASHKKDNHSRYGFLKMVASRRKLLDYLSSRNVGKYKDILSKLNLRR